ncbi:TIGR02186 family protein [Citreicella sp. C3M06]|uniref:TIGR02186 family protein n=1 Tax=Roseobacteraceae TaxID=2854170 RepID=UPI001C087E21|nr:MULTISPECIES: TIGR02186 family protein [Roseobacteraceae]MBU2961732.1 TIGR02186 family protein [Citreicella sp. C3M06]MDO6583980.1 TIGR02186 family protein [Salipiger sp. 1_MG-2023]
MIRALALLLLLALPASAEEVVMGLSRDSVAITTDFDGSEVLIFGAVKRQTEILTDPPLQVIVTVSGPVTPVTVWRKERRLGIWVNADAVEIDAAPSFYAVASSAPWDQSISEVEDLRHKVSVERAIRSVGAPMGITDSQSFTDGLIRMRTNDGLFETFYDSVEFREATLFDVAIRMPATIVEGTYTIRVLLTRSGKVLSQHASSIEVRKVGLERWLFNLSRQQPALYGLLSIVIAIAAGWGASAAFRALRSS